jgi:FkbH-like protein
VLTDLIWLPDRPDWLELFALAQASEPQFAFEHFRTLASSRMDFARSCRLDKAIERYRANVGSAPGTWPTIRLAVLGSSTVDHLVPGIRLAGIRRGFNLELYVGPYGLYRQEIDDPGSGLHRFHPDVILIAIDAHHIAAGEHADAQEAVENLQRCWEQAKNSLHCAILQQTILPVHPLLLGNNEDRLPQSPACIVQRVNQKLRESAESHGIYLLSVDTLSAIDGVSIWHDAALWNRAKQEIHPRVSAFYGDQVGRLLGAIRGQSSKCLVLDLDNTLWGGVIGDDGMDAIVLGNGSAVGEAHLALQRYALQLSRRGILLAVCSKNDEANALAVFEQHPEMLLRKKDIACFVANWSDKASNLRTIAETLNIGIDSLVFVDDNPVERALIRRELPMVAVPELPDEPAAFVQYVAAAGYFEAIHVTQEDRERAESYRANAERNLLRTSTTDMGSFLEALKMELTWSSFDPTSLKRIVQLMNKTNQFNLTTHRYTEAAVLEMMEDPDTITLQLRLSDVYGDNGLIALVTGQTRPDRTFVIENWLMSCRVLGRNVEQATLNILAMCAAAAGATCLLGTYLPTPKNSMVAELYQNLGFTLIERSEDGSSRWSLSLETFAPVAVPMRTAERAQWKTHTSIAS